MFLKFRIMRKLSFENFIFFDDLYSSFFFVSEKSLCLALKMLDLKGYIEIDDYNRVKLLKETSYYSYRVDIRKSFFEITVSISAITVALIELIMFFRNL